MSSEKVLVWLKYRFIGDAVLATPLLHALAAHYDGPQVMTAPHLQLLLKGEPGLQLIKNSNKRGASDFFRQLTSLRKERYTIAVIVNRSFRSALMARMAGVKRRIGFPTEGRGFLLTDSVPYDSEGFEGECYARLGDPLGLNVVARPPKLTISEDERAKGDALRNGARIGLLAGCTVTERAITTQMAAEIENLLGEPVVLLGAAEERRFIDPLLPLLVHNPVDLVGACSLRETMGVIAGLKLVIGPDSGLIHVSAGLAVPTIATFCYSPHEKWGHHYSPHTVFQTPDRTMETMDVSAVLSAAEQVLG